MKVNLNNTTLQPLISILTVISRKSRKFLLYLLIISIFAGVIEVSTLGTIYLFVNLISSNYIDLIKSNFVATTIINNYDMTQIEIQVYVAILIILLCILGAIFGFLSVFLRSRCTCLIGNEISNSCYSNFLSMPYSEQITKNSSLIISDLSINSTQAASSINLFLGMITSTILSLSVIVYLLLSNTTITLILLSILSITYLIIGARTSNRLFTNSTKLYQFQSKVIKLVSESYGALRDIIISSKQPLFENLYRNYDYNMRKIISDNQIIGSTPRYLIESLATTLMITICLWVLIAKPSNITLGNLAVLLIGFQKLSPLFNLIFKSWSAIKARHEGTISVVNLLRKSNNISHESAKKSNTIEKDYINNISYEYSFQSLSLQNVGFSYKHGKSILENITLNINRGSRIGIVGKTGSGKSTLVDILMGLIMPSSGTIKINNNILNAQSYNWSKSIFSLRNYVAHVPQQMFLLDTDIATNIAFALDSSNINYERVVYAAQQACIDEYINNLPTKYHTIVGERGISLSGGQIQRIAIARAIYQDKPILFLDEATSALDEVTEEKILRNLMYGKKDLTIIMISHKKSTLKNCDFILNISNKSLSLQNI